MGKKLSLHNDAIALLKYWVIGVLILSGCVTVSEKDAASVDGSKKPVIESVRVSTPPDRVLVEIINSRPVPYTAFRLIDPPRIILDLRGIPGKDLPLRTDVNRGNVKDIRFEEGKTQAMTTRMIIGLIEPMHYQAIAKDHIIRLSLNTKSMPPESPKAVEKAPSTMAGEKDAVLDKKVTPSEPRIFVKPKPSDLNQVLGVDFTMLSNGKSRVTVTTDKKGPYEMDRQGSKTLILEMPGATIPPQVLREIDSSLFEGAVERIKPSFSPADKKVSIAIILKEMVPFHVQQTDRDISVDFGPTSIKPVKKKIVPLQMVQPQAELPAQTQPQGIEGKAMVPPAGAPGPIGGRYTGAPMTMDFINADITNILRLVGEVSNLNIVWGPEVTGNVSMRLKNVPWDQALDLILDNNNLAQRTTNNVVWITTKAKMNQFQAEEKRKRDDKQREIEERIRKARADKEKDKEPEPLVTEYIGIDFAAVGEIQTHIDGILSDRGTISSDTRTNIIIIRDTASVVEDAKKIVKQFDTPVKQVMIQARIVDATDKFSRNLGIQWGTDTQVQFRNNDTTSWSGTPGWAPGNAPVAFQEGGSLYNPTLSSLSPADPVETGWTKNLGLMFTKLSSFGTKGMVLDMELALAETKGDAKVISAPKILASNGEVATISRGTTLIIPATENVASTTLDATLSLTVTPTVSYNNFVTMEVTVTDDSNASSTQFDTKAISTKMMVKSGETIVIGGIYKDTTSTNTSGIPGLSKIPLLGWLFKTEAKLGDKSELLIFITPTVLPSS